MFYVVTVYDSMNYGSYFQAHAIEWELGKYDSVQFVDVHHQSTIKQTINMCLRKLVKGKWSAAILDLKKYCIFKKAKKTFSVIDVSKIDKSDRSWYFFGSDEIWNISRAKISRTKEFFGYSFPKHHRVAIAPSINTSKLEQFENSEYIVQELNKFTAISVRDMHSRKVIERLISAKCTLVADPTLLFTKDTYKKYIVNHNDRNYILLYSYGRMLNNNVINAICEFAKKKGLSIISVGNWFDFCDKNIVVKPETFLAYVESAEYVFTDTFHGLMFSLIFEKQFLTFPCGNIKVEETLDILNIRERMYDGRQSIENHLGENIDYNILSTKVQRFGEETRTYIERCLN